jgi:hypothetical protein
MAPAAPRGKATEMVLFSSRAIHSFHFERGKEKEGNFFRFVTETFGRENCTKAENHGLKASAQKEEKRKEKAKWAHT